MQTLYPRTEADLIRIFAVANASNLTLHWNYQARRAAISAPASSPASSTKDSTANTGLAFDANTHLNQVLALDATKQLIMTQPGVKLSQLNSIVQAHGLWLPIVPTLDGDPTIGDLIHINAVNDKFLQHDRIVHYVAAIDAVMADASLVRFSTFGDGGDMVVATAKMSRLIPQLFEIATQFRNEIAAVLGAHPWRKSGYNLDIFDVSAQVVRLYNPNRSLNLAHLLVGSFGQLAFPKRITLRLESLPDDLTSASRVAMPTVSRSDGLATIRDAATGDCIAFSAPLQEAFGRVKQLFDPDNRLNPVGRSEERRGGKEC